MEPAVPETPAASPPDPSPDRPDGVVPERVAFLLHAVRILLGYGHHLLATIGHRAAAPSFNTIAACFGTANLATILAHLNRGLMRAAALERLLLARAATGRDIDVVERRPRTPPPAPADAQAEPPATRVAARKPRPQPLRTCWDDPGFVMPTEQDLERQVRRRPIGRTILDICLDLAVVPGFCTGEFWNELFDILHWFGGSVAALMQERCRREQAFAQELDRRPGSNWDWLSMKRDTIRQVLGFFIGEPPIEPVATGPP
jgi:hypothetical protein